MNPIKCHICNRAVIARTFARGYKLAKEEGWVGGHESPSCPEHRRDNPVKNYWRIRDIREATSNESELRNIAIYNWHLRRERVG